MSISIHSVSQLKKNIFENYTELQLSLFFNASVLTSHLNFATIFHLLWFFSILPRKICIVGNPGPSHLFFSEIDGVHKLEVLLFVNLS